MAANKSLRACRRGEVFQTKCQNGEEIRSKLFWPWNDCWCQTGWFEYLRNSWSPGIFTHNSLESLQRMVRKTKKTSSEQTGRSWQEGDSNAKVKVHDCDPQSTAVGPLDKALNATLPHCSRGVCLLLSLINYMSLWIKASNNMKIIINCKNSIQYTVNKHIAVDMTRMSRISNTKKFKTSDFSGFSNSSVSFLPLLHLLFPSSFCLKTWSNCTYSML